MGGDQGGGERCAPRARATITITTRWDAPQAGYDRERPELFGEASGGEAGAGSGRIMNPGALIDP